MCKSDISTFPIVNLAIESPLLMENLVKCAAKAVDALPRPMKKQKRVQQATENFAHAKTRGAKKKKLEKQKSKNKRKEKAKKSEVYPGSNGLIKCDLSKGVGDEVIRKGSVVSVRAFYVFLGFKGEYKNRRYCMLGKTRTEIYSMRMCR